MLDSRKTSSFSNGGDGSRIALFGRYCIMSFAGIAFLLNGCRASTGSVIDEAAPPERILSAEEGQFRLDQWNELLHAPRGSMGGVAIRTVYRQGGKAGIERVLEIEFRDIPAIRLDLVNGPKDRGKFEVLLLLARDVDYSVHRAASEAMRTKYGFDVDWGLTTEERVSGYKRALEWWRRNGPKLEWDESEQRFVLPPE